MSGAIGLMEALAADLKKSDERYRYLRNYAQYAEQGFPICISSANSIGHATVILSEEELDEAVDAGIARLKELGEWEEID